MQPLRPRRPSPALVISIIALVVAMGGTGYAAFKLPRNSVGTRQLKKNAVVGSKVKNHSLTGSDLKLGSLGTVANARHSSSADSAISAISATTAANATNAESLGGMAAAQYIRFGQTLPSGVSESGDFGIRTANTGTSGFLDTAVTFPVPLATRIPTSKIVITDGSGTTHCSGPGHAERGFLCIYQINTSGVTGPPEIQGFENNSPQDESGNFGFDAEWGVNAGGAFSIGTYTVTAP